ncbi:MAG: MBL fold metallo-hydrolase [Gemmatimonadota bacterium]
MSAGAKAGLIAELSRRSFVRRMSVVAAAGGLSARSLLASALSESARSAAQEGLFALLLGSVQDAGLPQAGCYSELCEAARAEGAEPRFVTSLALVEPQAERFYLVDASPDLTRQMDLIPGQAFRARSALRRPFDGIFLTHAHMGHYLGLAHLGREGLGTAPTPCYCTDRMASFLENNGPWSLLVEEGRLVPQRLATNVWIRIDEHLEVMALPVPHRQEYSDTVGFVFRGSERQILYLPDIDRWEKMNPSIESVVRQVDVALLDGSFYTAAELPGRSQEDIPHPLIPSTMDRLQSLSEETEIAFIHLNNTNRALMADGPEALDVARRGFHLPRKGQRYAL